MERNQTDPEQSDRREVWLTEEGGVASTRAFRDRLAAGDPEAHRELGELSKQGGIDVMLTWDSVIFAKATVPLAIVQAAAAGETAVIDLLPYGQPVPLDDDFIRYLITSIQEHRSVFRASTRLEVRFG